MRNVSSSAALVHWSKDFVEHLRTVHFALIAVAVALAVLVLSSKEYNAVNALVQIEEIIDLKHNWSPAWIEQNGDAEPSYIMEFGDIYAPDWKDRSVVGLLTWTDKGKAGRLVAECVFPKVNWYQPFPRSNAWSPMTFPASLREFESWWGILGQTYHAIYVPRGISAEGIIEETVSSSPSKQKMRVGAFRIGSIDKPQQELQLVLSPSPRVFDPDEATTETSYSYSAPLDESKRLTISVHGLSRYGTTRNALSRHYHNLGTNEYKVTFADLAKATSAITDLSLQDVKDFIHDEAIKGPEVFEVFGMKFPAGQVTLWGIVLMLSVELYFFLYLRQLTGKLGPSDAGWDVPWIGMDSSKLGQSMFFVTLVPLPCAALVLLGTYRTFALLSGLPSDEHARRLALLRTLSTSAKVEVAILLLACIVSLVLGLVCWKYRPRLTSSPQPETGKEDEGVGTPERIV